MTHAWQHSNGVSHLDLKYREGHSTFVEIECTRELGDVVYANFMEKNLEADNSAYGEGFRYWKETVANESDKNIFNLILRMKR